MSCVCIVFCKAVQHSHFVQVRVKVGDDEWSVHRRYAEFREFHSQVSGAFDYLISNRMCVCVYVV